jgi:hypothetical protein
MPSLYTTIRKEKGNRRGLAKRTFCAMPSIELFTPNDREDDMRLIRITVTICLVTMAVALFHGSALAEEEKSPSALRTLLLYGRTPEGKKKGEPRLFAIQFVRLGIFYTSVPFENIPDNIRRVQPYDSTRPKKTLAERARGNLLGPTFGFGVYALQRFELAVDVSGSMSDGDGHVWYPSDDAVGYTIFGSVTMLTLSTRIVYGLHVKTGYCATKLDLYSGTEAWASFRPQHRMKLPRRDLIVYSLAYKIFQPFFEQDDAWFDFEVEYGVTISPEHDPLPYLGFRGIIQAFPISE